MRCPKCGAFLEQGKVICNMCGTNSTTYVPEQTNNFNNDGMFSTGMNTGGRDFSSAPPAVNKYASVSTKKDYHNVELVPVKNGEKDIFDFFSENKKLLSFLGVLLVFGIIALIGWKYYEWKSEPPVIEPKFRNLYYEVDSSFETVEDSDSKKVYSRSGNKGNDCSITITNGTSTTGDHVQEYFAKVHKSLEPEKDSNGNIVDQLDVYTPSEKEMTINGSTWYSLNLFYKVSASDESPTNLKYKYVTSMYKGYFYDIELVNNSNDTICGASLDNFSKSLKFIDKKDSK